VIAQDSRNRAAESALAQTLSRLEAAHGDPLAALEYTTVAIRNYHDAGNTTNMRAILSFLAVFLDRLGRYESAATIAGFAVASHLPLRSPPRSPTSAACSATKPTNHSRARVRR
jgi:hypothetical protein